MNAPSDAVRDSVTMLARNLRHQARYPSLTAVVIGLPLVFLLLFVFVFGDTLGDGLGGASAGRGEYLDYVAPGVLVLTVAAGAQGTAMSVAMDMADGIVARFRTMAISRAAVLTGHVLGSVIQTLVGMAVVVAVAVAIGFRPTAGPQEWMAAVGLLALATLAVTWLSVALGTVAKGVESASNLPMPLILLPFLGSGFAPTESMPAGLAAFAEHQPFTPVIETLRGLLTGTAIGGAGAVAVAVAWCVAIGLVGYLWARAAYEQRSVH